MKYSVTRLDSAPRVPLALDGRIVYTSDRFEVVHLSLKPGEGMELHTMPFEVIFFVREGCGTLCFDDDEVKGSSGDCIHVEPGVRRGWRNSGRTDLEILVMKLLKK